MLKKKVYFVQKVEFRYVCHSMHHSPRERARASTIYRFFLSLFFWDGLILCVTLYTTEPCGFLQSTRSFLSMIYSKTDTNNNYP